MAKASVLRGNTNTLERPILKHSLSVGPRASAPGSRNRNNLSVPCDLTEISQAGAHADFTDLVPSEADS